MYVSADAADVLDVEVEEVVEAADAAEAETSLPGTLVTIFLPNGIRFQINRWRKSAICMLNRKISRMLWMYLPQTDWLDRKRPTVRLITLGA